MKFSQRLCDAKFISAARALTAARNQVPGRNNVARRRPAMPHTPARPSTIAAAAVETKIETALPVLGRRELAVRTAPGGMAPRDARGECNLKCCDAGEAERGEQRCQAAVPSAPAESVHLRRR
jgi:hypothetical protein